MDIMAEIVQRAAHSAQIKQQVRGPRADIVSPVDLDPASLLFDCQPYSDLEHGCPVGSLEVNQVELKRLVSALAITLLVFDSVERYKSTFDLAVST
jgi:hypothetical protein